MKVIGFVESVISKILQLPSPEAVIKNFILFLDINSILFIPRQWALWKKPISFMDTIWLLPKVILNNFNSPSKSPTAKVFW